MNTGRQKFTSYWQAGLKQPLARKRMRESSELETEEKNQSRFHNMRQKRIIFITLSAMFSHAEMNDHSFF